MGVGVRDCFKCSTRSLAHRAATDPRFERDANLTVASIDQLSTVEDRVDAERRLHDVWVELRALSAQDRDLVLLFAWEQFSYSEIAETLSIPVGTVRSRLNRIRASLTPIEPKEYQRD